MDPGDDDDSIWMEDRQAKFDVNGVWTGDRLGPAGPREKFDD